MTARRDLKLHVRGASLHVRGKKKDRDRDAPRRRGGTVASAACARSRASAQRWKARAVGRAPRCVSPSGRSARLCGLLRVSSRSPKAQLSRVAHNARRDTETRAPRHTSALASVGLSLSLLVVLVLSGLQPQGSVQCLCNGEGSRPSGPAPSAGPGTACSLRYSEVQSSLPRWASSHAAATQYDAGGLGDSHCGLSVVSGRPSPR